MYLYLGQNTVVNSRDIIGIFDLDNTSSSRITRHFLHEAQKSGQIREVSSEIPKSFVVCKQERDTVIYLSQIAPSTLKKRTGFLREATAL